MEKIVFTNGCFDILHPGHISLLRRARELGTKLIVGINSDRSVRAIKGATRPIMKENDRAEVLSGIKYVDQVIIFDEPTPQEIIKSIKPDVLVKGGDWQPHEIIGSDTVLANGGEVYSLPLVEGFSSTGLITRMNSEKKAEKSQKPAKDETDNEIIQNTLRQHLKVFSDLTEDYESVKRTADLLFEVFKAGKKVFICGNGGSAADAQHIAAEFVGRYETERRALPAIALTTDTSALTALANDYDFERIFTRQIEALAADGDCLIAISTSGNSPNVLAAVMKARQLNCRVIGLTGENGRKLASLCDECVMIPSARTARIQEAHITVAHLWCELIDRWLQKDKISGDR